MGRWGSLVSVGAGDEPFLKVEAASIGAKTVRERRLSSSGGIGVGSRTEEGEVTHAFRVWLCGINL